jgi:hypothetical protein
MITDIWLPLETRMVAMAGTATNSHEEETGSDLKPVPKRIQFPLLH